MTAPSSWSGKSAGARRYDAIIMDPPSYGRGPGGEVWKLEENLYPFVKLCARVLSDKPLFVILNSYTTGSGSVGAGISFCSCWWARSFGGRCDVGRAGPAVYAVRYGAALRRYRPLDGGITQSL